MRGGAFQMDVLDEILSSLRLAGGVVVDGEFSGDFCVAAEFTPGHFARGGSGPRDRATDRPLGAVR